MNLIADESVAGAIVERLRADGHDVVAIRDVARGQTDDRVLALADAEGAILVTEDKDFGELVYRLGAGHRGVVLVRLAGLGRAVRSGLVSDAFRDHGSEFVGRFTVITPGGLRIRVPQADDPP